MANLFQPKLECLPAPQRQLWSELTRIPKEFVLYGDTAIALQLAHRVSMDFDFFGTVSFDSDRLLQSIPFLQDSVGVLQNSPNTLTVLVDRGGPVKLSFFGVPELRRVREPLVSSDIQLQIADLLDLAGTKVSVVQKRAEAKDYLDLDALMQNGGIDLPTALAASQAIYGRTFNSELTLKALCFFGDGNLSDIPQEVQTRLIGAVKVVDLQRLPFLEPLPESKVPESLR
jgi:Nucleotidyl transferase AbiEii toxin, Type IV TA system